MAPHIPYSPGEKIYPDLAVALRQQLAAIEPTPGGSVACWPCAVDLADGSAHERVYIRDARSYISEWGVWPEDDPGKDSIDVTQVIRVRKSSARLPSWIARTIYDAGESGMGYTIFSLVFRDGSREAYVTGNAVDFVAYPAGKSSADVVAVEPHRGREENPYSDPVRYVWCLYGRGVSTTVSKRWTG